MLAFSNTRADFHVEKTGSGDEMVLDLTVDEPICMWLSRVNVATIKIVIL